MLYFVLVTKREKRACRRGEERGVVAATLPMRIIEKSLVSDQVILDAVISKYSSHLPLYRQSVIFLRDAGIDVSRATIDGWVMRVGDLLTPLVGVMGRDLVGGSYIQADETPVDVQKRDGRLRNHQAYLWQYGTPGGAVIFEFRMGRGREGPLPFLGDFEGILQMGWRRTLMRPTTVSADRRWCMRLVGPMPGGSSTNRSNSISRTWFRRGSWCRWESCLPSSRPQVAGKKPAARSMACWAPAESPW